MPLHKKEKRKKNMSDRDRILEEIVNLAGAAGNVLNDDPSHTSVTWVNRVIALLLWVAEHLTDETRLLGILQELEQITEEL